MALNRFRRVSEDFVSFSEVETDLAKYNLTEFQARVYAYIVENAGVWRNELKRVFGQSVVDILFKLERLGLVESRMDGMYKRYYAVRRSV